MTTPAFYLRQLILGPMQNFIYLIGDPKTREAAVVDPGWEVPTILRTLEQDGYRLTKAFVTHHHFDHVMGLEELLRHADIPVHVHQDDAPLVAVEPGSRKPVHGGDTIAVGGVTVSLLHTPGHTPGSQCLLVNGHLFSGDTLFVGSCGRCDLPGGNPAALYHSLSGVLKPLDDSTILCPGHDYGDAPQKRLGEEKQTNPFLQPKTVDDFLRLVGR